jgi:polysaccharide biosynthesis transport protein
LNMDAPRLSPVQNQYQSERGFQDQPDSLSRLLDQLIGLVRRQLLLIVVISVLIMALGFGYLMTTPATYTAHAKLVIDSSKVRALQQQQMALAGVPIDFTEVETQVEVLKSDNIGLAVVKDQHLTENPAFVGGTEEGLLQRVFTKVTGLFGSGPVNPTDTRSQSELTRTALGTLLGQRTVTRLLDTYVLDIGYSAQDPNLAAKMANAIADAYIVDQFEAKYQTTRRAGVWLQDRIKELRAQAAAADLAVSDYKEKNKIVDLGGGGTNVNPRLLGDEQVAQLNVQLITGRAATAEAKARLDRINEIINQDVPDAGTVDSLQSSVIARLRNQYLDLAARERIFADRYGKNHLAVVNLRTQMVELRRSIADELNRIGQSYKSDYEIAKARVQTLETSLAGLISNTQLTNRDRIGLRDLESTARVYHSIYDNFLSRYMESTQQQSFPITEARVISQAAPPNYRSAPSTRTVLGAAAFLGVILGFAAGFLREAVDRVFRTRHQIEEILRTNCLAVLPRLTTSVAVVSGADDDAQGLREQTMPGKKFVTDGHGFFRHVLEEPRSLFAEGLRSIKVAADIASAIKENKIIGVTSSVAKEGKSTIASNFAELMAHAGKRVILVDGDLRNLTLSRSLGRGATAGLLEVLAGQIDLRHVVYTDSRSGLTFLPAVIDSRLAHTDEILASKMFKRLLDALRSDYDYIIVDLPPLAPVSDARATAGIIDSYIYVIEWGRTKINVVQHQLAAAPELYDRLLGIVLSKANIKILARYEQYYGRNYYKNYDARYGYGS